MKIIKQGNLTKQEYKMTCWKCGCEALYTSDDVRHNQRDGDYVECPCCGSFVYHNE